MSADLTTDLTPDLGFMQRALELARATVGLASPNPYVGCVLVRDGEVLGEGAHIYDGRDHAEIVALKQAAKNGRDAKGATAYVTLEPCSHHGRTGPCADALIAAGVARCVAATVDPNALVSGRGVARLRAAGVEVLVGLLEGPARALNDAFAHFIQQRRPFVTLKAALSIDGRLAPPPATRAAGRPFWLTGEAARAEVQRLRHSSDAILTGIGTVLADDPALTDRSADSHQRRRPLLRVVLDSQLRLPLTSQLVRGAEDDLLVLCGGSAPAARMAALAALGVEVVRVWEHDGERDGRLDLQAVLKLLGERQILSLLVEGGSGINGAFLAEHLVDKAVLFYSQTALGDDALPFATGIESPFIFEQTLARMTRSVFPPDLCVTGYLTDPWPPASPEEVL